MFVARGVLCLSNINMHETNALMRVFVNNVRGQRRFVLVEHQCGTHVLMRVFVNNVRGQRCFVLVEHY